MTQSRPRWRVATVVHEHFEWDRAKAAANLIKHGVSLVEASTVLQSLDAKDFADPVDPLRVITIGFSVVARMLVVVSTEPGVRVRIISARRATPAERRAFDQG